MEDMGVARDIPIVLNSINYEDSYRGTYDEGVIGKIGDVFGKNNVQCLKKC